MGEQSLKEARESGGVRQTTALLTHQRTIQILDILECLPLLCRTLVGKLEAATSLASTDFKRASAFRKRFSRSAISSRMVCDSEELVQVSLIEEACYSNIEVSGDVATNLRREISFPKAGGGRALARQLYFDPQKRQTITGYQQGYALNCALTGNMSAIRPNSVTESW
jgi:hypothetical protein